MEVKQLFEDIKNYNTIIIHRHTRPDLDALGSQLGLKKIIEANYPSKKVYAVGDATQKYAFIGDMDIVSDDLYKGALVIIVDVAVSYMISDERYKLADKVWVIDHHKNDCDVSENWLCDTTRVAAAEYITYLVLEEGLTIPKEAATCLFGGIITDSGRFLYGSKVSNTLRVAASLIDLGADSKYIYDNIYIETLAEREMKNYFASKIQMRDGVAWLVNKGDVFDKFHCEFNDVSRGMLSLMVGIEEIKIWCNFTYDKESDTVKCEFRSRGIEIVEIAKALGGGGHANACGATIKSFDQVDSIIDSFVKLLKENN